MKATPDQSTFSLQSRLHRFDSGRRLRITKRFAVLRGRGTEQTDDPQGVADADYQEAMEETGDDDSGDQDTG